MSHQIPLAGQIVAYMQHADFAVFLSTVYYSNIRNRGWLAKMYLNGTLSMLAPEAPAAAVAAAAATAADDTDAQS